MIWVIWWSTFINGWFIAGCIRWLVHVKIGANLRAEAPRLAMLLMLTGKWRLLGRMTILNPNIVHMNVQKSENSRTWWTSKPPLITDCWTMFSIAVYSHLIYSYSPNLWFIHEHSTTQKFIISNYIVHIMWHIIIILESINWCVVDLNSPQLISSKQTTVHVFQPTNCWSSTACSMTEASRCPSSFGRNLHFHPDLLPLPKSELNIVEQDMHHWAPGALWTYYWAMGVLRQHPQTKTSTRMYLRKSVRP